jgi:stress response protein YsnF
VKKTAPPEKEEIMTRQTYAKETKTVLFQGKPITITHLTPIPSPEERVKIKREIEHQLYDVFIKYAGSEKKTG